MTSRWNTFAHYRDAWDDNTEPELVGTSTESDVEKNSPPIDEGYGSRVGTATSPTHPITKEELKKRIKPIFAINPMGPDGYDGDLKTQLKHLEAAFDQPPRPGDSQRRNTFVPGHLFPIPPSWPQRPHSSTICSLKFYTGLQLDTLFFLFYFYEGTVAQITAAQVLRNRNWRFHKQLRLWFQRLEVPKVITEDYERGSYRYWDPDAWSEKIRRDHYLEYRFLETENLNRWPQLRG